ncbi:hypothetical protein ACFQWC_13190 [Rossellomorea sp. GCM10028870]
MELTIRRRIEEDVHEFITWAYEGIYSFYDNNSQAEKIEGLKESFSSIVNLIHHKNPL